MRLHVVVRAELFANQAEQTFARFLRPVARKAEEDLLENNLSEAADAIAAAEEDSEDKIKNPDLIGIFYLLFF